MTAQIGYDGLDLHGDPRPELLLDVARVQPQPGGDWIDLEGRLGFRSTQRLWIGDYVAGGVMVATWPAELARQARYLYGGGLGSALVAAAIERGWTVEPSPHLAYYTAPAARRLYMRPSVVPLDYVACWEDEDGLRRVGNHTREDVEHQLWPWLKQRGFADDGDDTVLRRFLGEFLGNRPAQMRPGLRFRRVWAPAEAAGFGSALAETIRSQFDAMFAVAHEPALRPASPGLGAPLPPGTGNRPSAPPAATAPARSRAPAQSLGARACRTAHAIEITRPGPLTCALTWPSSGTKPGSQAGLVTARVRTTKTASVPPLCGSCTRPAPR